jgi:ankyrin repeat protein
MTADEMLLAASLKGSLDEVARLLTPRRFLVFNLPSEANVNFKAGVGFTALHLAVLNGHREVAKLLLEQGAQVDVNCAPGQLGDAALHIAVGRGDRNLVELLLDKGAHPNVRDFRNRTPLHEAATRGATEIAQLLIDRGAGIEEVYLDEAFLDPKQRIQMIHVLESGAFEQQLLGDTPLHLAARCGHMEMVKLLVDKGASLELGNWHRRTPLDEAVRCGFKEVADWLRERGAKTGVQASGAAAVEVAQATGVAGSPAEEESTNIKATRLILESEFLASDGSAVLTPPGDMIQSMDDELTNSGHIRRGAFTDYVAKHGLGEPKVIGAMTDAERLDVIRAAFPNDRWACCGRVTQMTRYNVVVAFVK